MRGGSLANYAIGGGKVLLSLGRVQECHWIDRPSGCNSSPIFHSTATHVLHQSCSRKARVSANPTQDAAPVAFHGWAAAPTDSGVFADMTMCFQYPDRWYPEEQVNERDRDISTRIILGLNVL